MAAARGMLPVAPDDMLRILIRLAADADAEIAATAVKTLDGWPESELTAQLRAPDCRPEVIAYFAAAPGSAAALHEAIITNRAASPAVVAALALKVPATLLETILYNRSRLLEAPEILQNARRNPSATPQILGLVSEIETEFFSSKKREYLIDEPEAAAEGRDESPGLEAGLSLEELPLEDLALEGLPLDPQEREAAILNRINRMTVREKMRLALMGTRELRAALIRDTNRQVCQSVLQSPKLSVGEVESFAAMRTVSEEVLRQIGNSREWTKSYQVVQNLVRNPKTPPMISQRMLIRLQNRDLLLLSRDHGIADAVRRNAQRLISQRKAPSMKG